MIYRRERRVAQSKSSVCKGFTVSSALLCVLGGEDILKLNKKESLNDA